MPVGCATSLFKGDQVATSAADADGREPVWNFRAAQIRVYPSSRFKLREGAAVLDLRLELTDDMGDAVKAVGQAQVELYQGGEPNRPSLDRKLYVWQIPLRTLTHQRMHWDSITRAYVFQLVLDEIPQRSRYATVVVNLTLEDGRRLNTRQVIAVDVE